MMKAILTLAIVALRCGLWAQSQPEDPPSAAALAEISARGQALAEYDAAAWHATDAVMAIKPAEAEFKLYVGGHTPHGWRVVFGRFNETATAFYIVYEAQQTAKPAEYKVIKHDPPVEDTDVYLRAAMARTVAASEFRSHDQPGRPYNISVLPAPAGEWYVYALPAQTDFRILPTGGDVRYTVSADGKKIVDVRQMHKIILEDNIVEPPSFAFHTHVISDVPEDSDIFYTLTRKAVQGEWIATPKYFYKINPDGALNYVGKTDEILKLLQQGNSEVLPAEARAGMLPALRRLLHQAPAGTLEARVEFLKAECVGGDIRLRFSIILSNISDHRIILYKDPLGRSKAWFAASESDVRKDKSHLVLFAGLEQPDFADESSFIMLGPGMDYKDEQELPFLGVDLSKVSVVQFQYLTWPFPAKDQENVQRKRWASEGVLYTGDVLAEPSPVKIDPELIQSCKGK